MSKILFIDTETNGLPRDFKAPYTDTHNWPRIVQVAWLLADEDGNTISEKSYIIKPDGWIVGGETAAIHGITTGRATLEGVPIRGVIDALEVDLIGVKFVVCHNTSFDRPVIAAEYCRVAQAIQSEAWTHSVMYPTMKHFCTMDMSTDIMKLPSKKTGAYKWPKLDELYYFLFGQDVPGRERYHDAMVDVKATAKCFFKLKQIKTGAEPSKATYGYQEALFPGEVGGWVAESGEMLYNNHLQTYNHFKQK